MEVEPEAGREKFKVERNLIQVSLLKSLHELVKTYRIGCVVIK